MDQKPVEENPEDTKTVKKLPTTGERDLHPEKKKNFFIYFFRWGLWVRHWMFTTHDH